HTLLRSKADYGAPKIHDVLTLSFYRTDPAASQCSAGMAPATSARPCPPTDRRDFAALSIFSSVVEAPGADDTAWRHWSDILETLMLQRKEDAWVYLPLVLLMSAYAVVLDRNKTQIEPDYTWLEVVGGTTMCLSAAAIRARLGPNDRATYERAVWLAFA